jgi:cytochrome c peroxidase
MKNLFKFLMAFVALVMTASCSSSSPDDLTEGLAAGTVVKYNVQVAPIIQSQCLSCHNGPNANGNLRLENFTQVRESAQNGSLIDSITRDTGDPMAMPLNGRMPQATINVILQWQTDGFLEN